MPAPRSILLLDDDDDLRQSLGDMLRRLRIAELVAVPDVASLIALGPRALACQLALLDVNLGPDQPSGLDAYQWLVDSNFVGRIVFLTGHARSHPMVLRAGEHPSVRVLQKPIGLVAIRELLQEKAA